MQSTHATAITRPSPAERQAPGAGMLGIFSRGVRVIEISGAVDSQQAASAMKSLVSEIARALVDETDKVLVEVLTTTESTVLRLHVAPSDIGKMIGKQGRTARSLRTILGAASMKLQRRFSLDIVETGRPDRPIASDGYEGSNN